VPLKEEGPDDDNPDFRYRIFTVWLEDIEGADVRQIWIDRFASSAVQAGSRSVLSEADPRGVGPAGGAAPAAGPRERGEDRIAEEVDATLRVRMGPFDPRTTKGLAMLRPLDVDLEGTARIAGVFPGVEGNGLAKAALHVQRDRSFPGARSTCASGRCRQTS